MKKKTNLMRRAIWVAVITLLILAVPLVAMQFTDEVKWSLPDFIIMGALIFSTGFSFVLLTKSSVNIIHRAAVALAVAATFLLIWVNLAVGLIGSGPNAANLMYAGIVIILIGGFFISRFTIKGMETAMFVTAIALLFVAVIQLLGQMYEYAGSSVFEVIVINIFFATLFALSGLLFRFVKNKPANRNNGGIAV